MPEILRTPYENTSVSPMLFIFALRYLDKELASCVEKVLEDYIYHNVALYKGTLHKAIAACVDKSKAYKERRVKIEGVVNDVKRYCENPPVATLDEFKSDVAVILIEERVEGLEDAIERAIFRWGTWAESCKEQDEDENCAGEQYLSEELDEEDPWKWGRPEEEYVAEEVAEELAETEEVEDEE